MADSLEIALVRTRAGYDLERLWHRFMLDAYTGGGGFAGRIGCPDAELGSAGAAYPACPDSYLDKYSREDDDKFLRRVRVAHYLNYVEPLTDLKVGLALSKPFAVEGLPDEIVAWKSNVDGRGTSWGDARARLAKRAAIVGWAPTIVDTPPTPDGVKTQAQAREQNIRPVLVPLYPALLTEWLYSGGTLEWVKIRNDFCERETFLSDEVKFSLVDVWDSAQVARYRLVDGKVAGSETIARSGGRGIPLTVLRHKEAEDDPMIGLPMNGQVAIESRRLFNLCSALDEALDGSCFPLLVLVDSMGPDTDSAEGGGEIVIGANNAITLPKDATKQHYYLTPPAEVFRAFEERIAATVREMFRMARVEFVRPAGSQNESGIARKHAFMQTNSAVGDFAKRIAAWEQATYVEVGRALGMSEDVLNKIRVVAPEDFDVEDIEASIKRLESAFKLKLGPLFEAIMKKRIVQEMAPNLEDKDRAAVEQEIDDMADDDASFGAFGKSGAVDEPLLDPNVEPNAPTQKPVPPPKQPQAA